MKKYAVVTGGTKGIGRGIMINLLERGYHVIATYATDDQGAEKLLEEYTHYQEYLTFFKCDQSKIEQTYLLTTFIKNKFPYINCLVGNAGATIRKKMTDITDTDWNTVMNVTVNSHFILIRELFSQIQPDSRIIFIGSLMGVHPHGTSLVYGVSKAALHALSSNLVKEFEGTNTTVNVIVPGFVETEWQKSKPDEIRQNIYAKSAIKRFAAVDEIVKSCGFILDNGFVNGSLLEVTGGYSFK
ncbi:SDR family oxidoreductase [Sphingobacterium sp. SRCM116780]|uniref:SDR family NAD(P)-dependent oxidoreductase n=1 Tax=Sphingobacterium sp. SRCM116780 TaxID=2907623 RepID=UPI001F37D65A|nr:SDR family oxidoreductase [Sphingobacterium sp. SRCM116780]UIR56010.1 SDR family oxidoreductase [Sphingobacterium sp. SRCM116780]